ncbi:MAG: hypothetical protein DCC71_17885 [Proteobacteria bacterium]|nr:MAG: hypothetical protein DCC71_17885 [Pseudomonadota bacterium]
MRRVENAVGARLDPPVDARVIEAADAPQVVRSAATAGTAPEARAAAQDGLVALGIVPAGVDLLETVAIGASRSVAGLYVPADRRLYVVRDPMGSFASRAVAWMAGRDLIHEMPLAHEIVHAIQHQVRPALFDSERFLAAHDDVAHAVAATYEGHATYYGLLALGLGELPAPDVFRARLRREFEGRRGTAFPDAPAFVRAGVFTGYADGYRLAANEAAALLTTPPASTEQVRHAGRRHEPFEAIDLGAARGALPEGCAFVAENGAGELGIAVLLADLGAPEASLLRASPAAEGWAGDRYVAARCAGRREFVWLTLWDAESDAAEFAAAYATVAHAVRARADLVAPPLAWRRGREVVVASPALAPVAEAIVAGARRGSVTTLADYFAFWSGPDVTSDRAAAATP